MNLNEECLLQFLKNDLPPQLSAPVPSGQDQFELNGGFLTRNLRRILRRKNYVSFPVAILVRRPSEELE
jgi:hypothetical protein